jgi:hypothetical protein
MMPLPNIDHVFKAIDAIWGDEIVFVDDYYCDEDPATSYQHPQTHINNGIEWIRHVEELEAADLHQFLCRNQMSRQVFNKAVDLLGACYLSMEPKSEHQQMLMIP